MRYLAVLALSCLAFGSAYFSVALALSPSPILAEYWVREMIVIKRNIARRFAGQRKVILGGGSSTLFSIDAAQLGEALHVPVINFGLHGGLSLKTVLDEAGAPAEKGDVVLLSLEPHFYCVNKLTAWQARNVIAWNHEQWAVWTTLERMEAIATLSPVDIVEMAVARMRAVSASWSFPRRLEALDDAQTLARFASAPEPALFSYSAYHLDSLGSMRRIEGSYFADRPIRLADADVAVCPASLRLLQSFVDRMRARGTAVYFVNPPYVEVAGQSGKAIERSSAKFRRELSAIAPVLDSKTQLVFHRRLFFDSDLHLNAEGRALRTRMLADAMLRDASLSRRLGPDSK